MVVISIVISNPPLSVFRVEVQWFGVAEFFVQAVVVPDTGIGRLVIEINEVDALSFIYAIVSSEHRIIILFMRGSPFR